MVLFQGQFEAWITLDRSDGAKREEYAIEVDEQRKLVTCWIASEVGKIIFPDVSGLLEVFNANFISLSRGAFFDGHWLSGIVCLPHDNFSTVVHHNYLTSSTTARPFMFPSLELTDDDVYLSTNYAKDIGEIRLTLKQVRPGEMTVPCPCQQLDLPPMDRKIHERSKQMMAHRIGNLGKLYSTYLATATDLISAFCLAMLQANGVVQSSPDSRLQAPEPPRRAPKRSLEQEDGQDSEEDGDDEDDDDDEEEEKALLAKLAEVRARRGNRDTQRPRKKVKMEDTPVEMNYNNSPGSIIDLT
ncbi:uncharacterized protein LACBIDRAFT_329398 [Laccaria bicolor S238N-H82]|uniref:Predicted protein n=1 Tax=Laccaria bicolor (strain S238N-H82 / ATCC MYA-4686) TaxID=486041 RepID=B0DHV8_LACBS|nr:uncharacterized protein LACBIDRAFT_329398 [Laccaria bicolor S238N-H82]EDR05901.1 predicted protein [Laccaria bicolor S238N-H82]|eukprot:XP_001883577.1 predicted protein [Laccaria bicolor S238N-H82]